jgi:aspartyl-tRNA(Asn)/glutamyl-tRNA(Gln) amidotransferase subunit A
MVGQDPHDCTSLELPAAARLEDLRPASLKGLRIGLPQEYFGEGLQSGVRDVLMTALSRLASEGAELVEVSLPHTRFAIDTYYLLNTSEVSSNLSRFDGVRFGAREPGESLHGMIARTRDKGFGPEVKRRVLLGAFCLSKGYYEDFYLRALKVRTLITRDFQAAFQHVDMLATPVSPSIAFPLGEKTSDPLSMYLADIFTVTTALAALPALAIPAGLSQGMPVGLQLVGPSLSDVHLLEVSAAFQELTDHHLRIPPFD